MRLDYFIAHATGLSRREARRCIVAGVVRVDGMEKPTADTRLAGHRVWLNEELLVLPGEQYLMLHKPSGYVSSTNDHDGPSVLQLVPPALRKKLHIVGRLDADTTGLLLLTTDGDWSHRVTSPRSECPKVYRVTLARDVTGQQLQQLAAGVMLKDEPKATLPATVTLVADRQILLQIQEGRYHQVKRMLAAVGNHVEGLHREKVGLVELGSLRVGQWRALSTEEVQGF